LSARPFTAREKAVKITTALIYIYKRYLFFITIYAVGAGGGTELFYGGEQKEKTGTPAPPGGGEASARAAEPMYDRKK
jgi:hypothetical protein